MSQKKDEITQQKILDTLHRWRLDPVAFVREVFKVEPEKNQARILSAIPDNRAIGVKSGHGVGKTTTEAWLICWFLICHPNSRVACTAPTENQLTTVLWPEVAKWLQRSNIRDLLTWTKSKIYITGEEETAFAVYRTSNKPEALQGFHASNMMFILEEASGIPDEIWEPVEGALTTKNTKVIALGNPTRAEGNFYRAFTDQAYLWTNFTISCLNSDLVNMEYIERMARKYGKESDVYRVRVLGEFPSQVSDAFIPLYLCERSLRAEIEHTPVLRMGVDVARFGDDYSVWIIRAGGKIVHAERKQTMDTMEIAGKTTQLMREYNIAPHNIFIDEIGVGGGVVDRLHELNIGIVAVNVATKPRDEEAYLNTRVELWGVVRQELKDEKLNLNVETDREITQDLIGELASPKYKITSKGQFQLESKEDMKKRKVASPDIADALCLTYYYGENIGHSYTRVGGGMLYPPNY